MRFQDKVVVVTGAGSGIGKATALAFGREGAKVVAADIDAASAQATAEQIKAAGGQAESLQVDVSVGADVGRMVTTTVERLGRLDVMVNNAGVFFQVPVVLVPEEQWDWLMSINLRGVYLGCKHAVPQMIRQGKGVIVNTASIAGLRGFGGYGTYGAAKGGVVQLTKALAVEVREGGHPRELRLSGHHRDRDAGQGGGPDGPGQDSVRPVGGSGPPHGSHRPAGGGGGGHPLPGLG